MMVPIIDSHNRLQVENEIYTPWPKFKARGVPLLNRLHNPMHLREILLEQDLFSATWRAVIPTPVLRELTRYRIAHTELLETAQLSPTTFTELSQTNPALTLMVSAYWLFTECQSMPTRRVRDRERRGLLSMRRRQILSVLGYPGGDELAHIMQKIPASDCYEFHILRILALAKDHAVRRRLRHLTSVNIEVGLLLNPPDPILDMGLLELAAHMEGKEGKRVNELARRIQFNRDSAGLKPTWPYRGQIKSWDALLRAEHRTARQADCLPEMLPEAPIPVDLLPAGLQLEPLQTRSELYEEGRLMNNCSAEYEHSIYLREAFLYRMLKPERATVSVSCEHSYWGIEQAMLASNEEAVSAYSMDLLQRWLKQ